MLRIVSAGVIRLSPPPEQRTRGEMYRHEPDTPISFWEWDGNNLYVTEATRGDSHMNLFTTLNTLASGRVNRANGTASGATDPDFMTPQLLDNLIVALKEEYGDLKYRFEWQGMTYFEDQLREELGRL